MAQAETPTIEITDAMVDAGAEAILRELTHPERDDIGIYKAEEVAQIVFRSMLAKRDLKAGC